MPADAAAVITTRLEHDQRQPVCSFCYSMLKDGSKRTHDIHLPRDIAHIAHHLKTRYVRSFFRSPLSSCVRLMN